LVAFTLKQEQPRPRLRIPHVRKRHQKLLGRLPVPRAVQPLLNVDFCRILLFRERSPLPKFRPRPPSFLPGGNFAQAQRLGGGRFTLRTFHGSDPCETVGHLFRAIFSHSLILASSIIFLTSAPEPVGRPGVFKWPTKDPEWLRSWMAVKK